MHSPDEMNKMIERAITERKESEQVAARQEFARREQELTRAQFIGGLASRNGIQIRDLEGFANLESRRLLAGFVVSANFAKIPKEKVNHQTRSIGMPGLEVPVNYLLRNVVKGWKIAVTSWQKSVDSIKGYVDCHDYATLTQDGRVHATYFSENRNSFDEQTIRGSVIHRLANANAEWIEPDPSTYE